MGEPMIIRVRDRDLLDRMKNNKYLAEDIYAGSLLVQAKDTLLDDRHAAEITQRAITDMTLWDSVEKIEVIDSLKKILYVPEFLNKEILNNDSLSLDKNSGYFNKSENKNSLEEYDTEFVEELMSIEDYRNIAGDIFYNIFFIFLENFGDDASAFFLEKKILPRIYDNDVLNTPNYPLIVDVIFFAMCSLSEIFDVVENQVKSLSVILNVINNFLQMKIVVENSRILIDFMIFIYKYNNFIAKEKELFFKVIKFLLAVSKVTINEKIEQSCYVILSNLCYEKSNDIQNYFGLIDEIFSLFNNKYSKYDYKKISPLKNIIGIVLSLLGIKRINSNNILSPEKIAFYSGSGSWKPPT